MLHKPIGIHMVDSHVIRAFARLAIGAGMAIAFTQASRANGFNNSEVVRLLLSAERAREEALLAGGMRATFLMQTELNPYRVEYFARGQKWRVNVTYVRSERFPVGHVLREFANNTFELTTFNRWTGQGLIADPTIVQSMSGGLTEGINLPTEFWLSLRGQPISKLMEMANDKMSVLDWTETANGLSYTLRVPYGSPGPHHFRIHFSAEFNYAVDRVQWRSDETTVYTTATAEKMEQVNGGVYVPRMLSFTDRGPIKFESLNIGAPIEESQFRLDFPIGAVVANNITGGWFQEGRPGTSDIDLDLQSRIRELALAEAHPYDTKPAARRWFLVLNAIAIPLILLFAYVARQHHHRQRIFSSQSPTL